MLTMKDWLNHGFLTSPGKQLHFRRTQWTDGMKITDAIEKQ